MRVLISAEGNHVPDHHHMIVDGHGLLIDLEPFGGLGADPSVRTIEWDKGRTPGGELREFGIVTRYPGVPQTTDIQRFWELTPIQPYLDAHAALKKQHAADQAAFDASADAAAKVASTQQPAPDALAQVSEPQVPFEEAAAAHAAAGQAAFEKSKAELDAAVKAQVEAEAKAMVEAMAASAAKAAAEHAAIKAAAEADAAKARAALAPHQAFFDEAK
jgi:hypothetical protein